MGSTKFRRELREELPGWVKDGLVDDAQAARLAERYTLSALDADRQSRFVLALVLFGAVLLAAGAVSFVAAHWEEIPKFSKALLLLSAMGTAHGAGYWLWRVRGTHPHVGHGLMLLGTLLVGANLGLFGQMFHIDRGAEGGLFAWGVATLALAWAAESVPHVATGLGVLVAWWFVARDYGALAADLGAAAFGALGAWLAVRQGSRFALVLAAAVLALGLGGVVAGARGGEGLALAAPLYALALHGAGLMARDWPPLIRFVGTLERLALVVAAVVLVPLCFEDPFRELERGAADAFDARSVTALVGLALAAVAAYASGLRKRRSMADAGVAYLALAAVVGLAFFTVKESAAQTLLLVAANGVGFGLAYLLMWRGTEDDARAPFWWGLLFGVLLATCRFFEYTEGLLAKSLAFLAAGGVVLGAGLWFERRRTARKGAP